MSGVRSDGGDEREQARGGSGEPPVPDSASGPGSGEPARAGEEVAGSGAGVAATEGTAHPGVAETNAVEVPAAHEADVPDDLRAEIEEIISRYPQKRSAAIPTLFAIQRRYGWCTPEGIRQGAAVMGVDRRLPGVGRELLRPLPPRARRPPPGPRLHQHLLLDARRRRTARLLLRGDRHRPRTQAGHGGAVSPDGDVYVSGFECLGACDLAPMASIDERYYGPLDDADARAAVDALRSGDRRPPRAGDGRPARSPAAPTTASPTRGSPAPADSRPPGANSAARSRTGDRPATAPGSPPTSGRASPMPLPICADPHQVVRKPASGRFRRVLPSGEQRV